MPEYPSPPVATAPQESADGYESLVGRYSAMQTEREPYLRRARAASELTVPTLVPPQSYSGFTELPTPFQSVGARGLNNLASKLLLALFPPNAPFFKFVVDPYALDLAVGATGDAAKTQKEIEASLLKAEEAVQAEMETTSLRPYLHEAMKHLVVAGNAILYVGYDKSNEKPQVFHLSNFCVERCGDRVEFILIEEKISLKDLPKGFAPKEQPGHNASQKTTCIYTGCERSSKGWRVWQEALGKPIPGKEWSFSEEEMPYVVLRGEVVSGDAYGRGYVEQYQGDLQSLEGLSQAIVEGSAAASLGRFLVNPNGMTDKDEVAQAANWQFVPGREEDVKALQMNKYGDMQVTGNTAKGIEERLSYAFLLNSAVQRDAERVTAEEIRYMAQELEQGLGGVYSLLSHEFQLPLVTLLVERMKAEDRFPKLPKKVVRPSIVTGIEALGRGNDLNRLMMAMNAFAQAVGPEAAARTYRLNPTATRIFTAAGVRADDFLKTEEEIAQEAQAAQMAALAQKVGPNVVNAMAAGGQPAAQAQ
jgi:Autographiviridae portal protein